MGLRVKTTTSIPTSLALTLNDSLIRRFTRLRSTARGKFFLLTAIPKRSYPRLFLLHKINNPGWKNFTGFENTFLYSRGVSRRFTFANELSCVAARCDKVDLLRSGSEDFTTFGTSTVYDCATILRCHATTKPVCTLSLQNARLKCSFHLLLSIYTNSCQL